MRTAIGGRNVAGDLFVAGAGAAERRVSREEAGEGAGARLFRFRFIPRPSSTPGCPSHPNPPNKWVMGNHCVWPFAPRPRLILECSSKRAIIRRSNASDTEPNRPPHNSRHQSSEEPKGQREVGGGGKDQSLIAIRSMFCRKLAGMPAGPTGGGGGHCAPALAFLPQRPVHPEHRHPAVPPGSPPTGHCPAPCPPLPSTKLFAVAVSGRATSPLAPEIPLVRLPGGVSSVCAL